MFKVSFSADRYTEESIATGGPEESGFIDPSWNRYAFLEEGEEKTYEFIYHKEAEEFIESTIGATEPSGNSYYAADQDFHDGEYWNFAGHIEKV